MEAIDVMKQAFAEHVPPGTSISDMIEANEMQKQQEMIVASTPQEQQEGLRNQPPGTSAVFPNTGGQNFNTVGTNEPLDIKGYDKGGNLVKSYEAVPEGITNLDMKGADTVIENPTQYKNGGYVKEKTFAEKVACCNKS